ncbi:MAG: hypothetical protein JKY27_03930 [Magnetovibrio sp.]|nr:hypothetical protein [Magnetovibrio sp.]
MQILQRVMTWGGVGVALSAVLVVSACATPEMSALPDYQSAWPDPPSEPRFYFERRISSSADIVKMSSADRFKAFATGGGGSRTAIAKPYGVVVSNGKMYVGDSVARLVHMFDIKNGKYLAIGTEGIGALTKPLGIAVDQQERLYVIDATQKRVVIFGKDGKYLRMVDGRRYFDRPTGIAVNQDGSRIFVVDTGGVSSIRHRVVVFDGEGNYLQDIGTRGSGPGEFNLPLNATIGPDGTLYVVDGGNFRIQAFTQAGQFKFSFGEVGKRSGQFARPKSIAVDQDNNIYVSDAAFGNVQIFNQNLDLLMWIGSRSAVDLPGHYMLPTGIAVDRQDGRVYMVDQFFRKVEVYRPAALGKPDTAVK